MGSFWLDALSNFIAGTVSGVVVALLASRWGQKTTRKPVSSSASAPAQGALTPDMVSDPGESGLTVRSGDHSPNTLSVTTTFDQSRHQTFNGSSSGTGSSTGAISDSPGAVLVVAGLAILAIAYLYSRYDNFILSGVILFTSFAFTAVFVFLGYAARRGVDYRRSARVQLLVAVVGFAVVVVCLVLLVKASVSGEGLEWSRDAKKLSFAAFVGKHGLTQALPIAYRILGLLSAMTVVVLALLSGLGLVGSVRSAVAGATGRTPARVWRFFSKLGPRSWRYIASVCMVSAISLALCSGTAYKAVDHIAAVPPTVAKLPTEVSMSVKHRSKDLRICVRLTSNGVSLAHQRVRLQRYLTKSGIWKDLPPVLRTVQDEQTCRSISKLSAKTKFQAAFDGDGTYEGSKSRAVTTSR